MTDNPKKVIFKNYSILLLKDMVIFILCELPNLFKIMLELTICKNCHVCLFPKKYEVEPVGVLS